MDFLGNISLRLIGLLVTVGTLAAIYFFVVKPATDTANNAINSISGPLKETQREVAQAQEQLKQDKQTGDPGAQVDLNKLQRCVQKARQDVHRLQRCANRYGP